jgi:Protein of unknown function (DUF3574)
MNRQATKMLIATALFLGLASGIAFAWLVTPSPAAMTCMPPSRSMARLELLFGTSRPHSGPVSEVDWQAFLDSEVTPRFPAGLTVLRGPGQWRGGDGIVAREQSNVLIIWYEPSGRTGPNIEAIRAAYKQRFDQESVMRIVSTSCVSF